MSSETGGLEYSIRKDTTVDKIAMGVIDATLTGAVVVGRIARKGVELAKRTPEAALKVGGLLIAVTGEAILDVTRSGESSDDFPSYYVPSYPGEEDDV